jgi:hypothetical protein
MSAKNCSWLTEQCFAVMVFGLTPVHAWDQLSTINTKCGRTDIHCKIIMSNTLNSSRQNSCPKILNKNYIKVTLPTLTYGSELE